jgi:hypothetical protein
LFLGSFVVQKTSLISRFFISPGRLDSGHDFFQALAVVFFRAPFGRTDIVGLGLCNGCVGLLGARFFLNRR